MTKYEAEAKLLYSIVVAGKSAKFAEKALGRFFGMGMHEGENPFVYVRRLVKRDKLGDMVRNAKTGNYTKVIQAFADVSVLNAETCTREELEAIHGIGPKTSRFYLMWTRNDQNYAALDVHILRWLKDMGHDVPRSTPSGEKYLAIEKIFLQEAKQRGMKPRDLDSMIWEISSGGGHKKNEWPAVLQKFK